MRFANIVFERVRGDECFMVHHVTLLQSILVRAKDTLYMNQVLKKNQCQLKQLAESTHQTHNKHTVESYGAQHDEYYIKRGCLQ